MAKSFMFLVGLLLGLLFVVSITYFFYTLGGFAYKKVDSDASNQFYEREGKIYYAKNGDFMFNDPIELEDADSKTFRVINQDFAKDINNVYYENSQVKNVYVDSFVYRENHIINRLNDNEVSYNLVIE